jgi:hypothetical protein
MRGTSIAVNLAIMDESPEPSLGVPDDRLEKLHEAIRRFHDARRHLEEAMASTDYDHIAHVTAAENEVRDAEREVEEREKEVAEILHAPRP